MTEQQQDLEDQTRALMILMRKPTLPVMRSNDLIELAQEWDAELGRVPRGSAYSHELAGALIEIYNIVNRRLACNYLEIELPSNVRGPVGVQQEPSPLNGLVEGISPFEKIDIWATYLRDRPRIHTGRRRRQSRSRAVGNLTPGRRLNPIPQPGPQGIRSSRRVADQAVLPNGTLPGPVSEMISSEAYTAAELLANLALELIGTAIGPIISGLISAIAVVDAFEGARRTQARAAKAWGARLGVGAVMYIVRRYPPNQVNAATLRNMIQQSTDLQRQWVLQLNVLASVPAEDLMMESVSLVANAYNSAIRDSLSALREELQRRNMIPEIAELENFRRLVGERFVDSVRQDLR